MDQPLLAAAARKLAKEIIETGSIGFTKHAEEEMAKDKLASVDVINVLRGGVYAEAEWENAGWRHQVFTPADRRGDRIRERVRADHHHCMEKTMKCPQCRTPMQSSRENHRWDASGLSNVVLIDVEVRRCPACGERTVVIPRIEALHRALAMTVIARPGKLAPQEIRFLRKWLGWSGQDFARHFGVTPTTVSRWESLEDPSPMGGTAERLLRLSVAHGQPAEQYPVSRLAEIDDSNEAPPSLIAFKPNRSGWEPSVHVRS